MVPASARRAPRPRSTSDMMACIRRILHATAQRVGEDRPSYLRELVELRDDLDEAILEAVRGLRDSGVTWQEIGDATGTTRQAAIMKWTHRI